MKKLLLTGGCGYVGSHVLRLLLEHGYQCTVYDNLSTGNTKAISDTELIIGDIGDQKLLDSLFSNRKFDAVLHFAGFIEAGESMENPAKYFENNLFKPVALLESLRKHGPIPILFSSTAAVYGNPKTIPITEDAEILPTNPYGLTKYLFEEMLRIYENAYHIPSVSLRYFNAAGAHESGDIGENHNPESHLIPIICQAAFGKRAGINIYGTDYPTGDGTCIRDYIHVTDLAEAHLLALQALFDRKASRIYNLGNGKGFSVKEIIAAVKSVTGKELQVVSAPRRPGDPVSLVASSVRAKKELGWNPKYSLTDIVRSAWRWHLTHTEGYAPGDLFRAV